MLPKYEDLKKLFKEKIDKDYPESLYTMQFSLYIDNIIARIDLQDEAWKKEEGASERLFAVYAEQKAALLELKKAAGDVVKPQYFLK